MSDALWIALVTETKIRRDEARTNAEIVKGLRATLQGSTEKMFLQFLPIFNATRQKVEISDEAHLPPFYRLVYLMKIK